MTPTDIVSLENYQATAAETEHQASVRKLVLLILKQIPRPEGKILIKRFGICTCKDEVPAHRHNPKTLRAIGNDLGVSREWVRRKLKKLLDKMREMRNLK